MQYPSQSDIELAQDLREAIGMVLEEFLANAPHVADARFMVQAAFIVAGLQSMLAEQGPLKTAQVLGHGFAMTTGSDLVGALYGKGPQHRVH